MSRQIDPSDAEPSKTLFNRWRHEAQFISNQAVQTMWGKILAEEILSPDSINIRLLEIIKLFTKQDVIFFEKISKYIIHNSAIFLPRNLVIRNQHIAGGELNLLREYGLADHSPFFGPQGNLLKTTLGGVEDVPYIKYNNYFIEFKSNNSLDDKQINFCSLTSLGQKLYSLVAQITESDAKNFSKMILSLDEFRDISAINLSQYDADSKTIKFIETIIL